MEVIVSRKELEKALSILMNIVPSRATTTIISSILMETDENKIKVTATDLETTAIFEIPANVESKGSIVINGRKFYDLIKNLDREEIKLSVNKTNLSIVWEDGNYKIIGTTKDDYIEIPIIDKNKAFYIERKYIVRGTDYTKICVSKNDAQLALTGIYTKIVDGNFVMVSTDSFKLSSYKVKTTNENDDSKLIAILPVKALDVLIKSSIEENEIGVVIDGKRVGFVLSNGTIMTQVINEMYPDYEKVIKTREVFSENDSHMVISKELLMKALKRVMIFSDPNSKAISLRFGEEGLYIRSGYRDIGDGGEKIDGKLRGEPIEISVSAQFLYDIISKLETDNVCIDIKTPSDSIVIYEDKDEEGIESPTNEEVFYLLMPTYTT